MMAARCGSHHITTCEMVPIIAKTATNIIADNDLSDIITVIAKKSTNLAIGIDLPKPADIIVSEILSNEFLGEGVLSSIEDAKQRLLAPEGQIIPRSGSIRIALFGSEHIGKNLHVSHVNDFDLSKFNGFTSSKKSFDANLYNIKLYSDAIDAFSFDFVEQDYFPVEEKNIKIPVLRGGICHGIIQWIHMNMDEEITFENHPQIKTQASGWKHVIYAFPSPIDLKKKQIINILAKHNRIAPWFKFLSIEDA